jgi:hypothetical protein
VSQYVGSAELTVFGLGLDGLLAVRIGGRSARFAAAQWRGTDDAQAADVIRSVQKYRADVSRVHAVRIWTPALVSVANRTANATSSGGSSSSTGGAGGFSPLRSGAQRDLLSIDSLSSHSALQMSTATDGEPLLSNPISAYQPLSLMVALPGSPAPLQFNFSSLIYYSSQECIAPGVWRDDGMGGCLPCPVGGHWSATLASTGRD